MRKPNIIANNQLGPMNWYLGPSWSMVNKEHIFIDKWHAYYVYICTSKIWTSKVGGSQQNQHNYKLFLGPPSINVRAPHSLLCSLCQRRHIHIYTSVRQTYFFWKCIMQKNTTALLIELLYWNEIVNKVVIGWKCRVLWKRIGTPSAHMKIHITITMIILGSC